MAADIGPFPFVGVMPWHRMGVDDGGVFRTDENGEKHYLPPRRICENRLMAVMSKRPAPIRKNLRRLSVGTRECTIIRS